MATQYDIVVIGGGPAGYAAAIYAAKKGSKVALIEKDRLGGTCLNRGCIPTKTYCASAELLMKMRESKTFAINDNGIKPEIDFDTLFERKESVVKKQVEGIGQLIKGNKIDLLEGDALIEDNAKVLVNSNGSSSIVEYKNLLIATGSEPSSLRGIDIDHRVLLNSTDILQLKKLPASLLIIGGGVIGVEFAMIMSAFGVKVYLVEILKRIISTEDAMASRIVSNRLKNLGVDINVDTRIEDLKSLDDGLRVELSNKKSFVVEKALVAAGRIPILSASDVIKREILTERGFVKVNSHLQTNIANIYAAGDVIGGMMLAHKAHYDGEIAISNMLGEKREVDYSAVPAVIYTQPEVASVGLSEEKAKEMGIDIKVGRFFVASNGMAMARNATEGFVKVVSDKASGKIVGGTIVCESASEMITTITIAIREGLKFEDIEDIIWPHPTISESIGEAMRDIKGMAIHKAGI